MSISFANVNRLTDLIDDGDSGVARALRLPKGNFGSAQKKPKTKYFLCHVANACKINELDGWCVWFGFRMASIGTKFRLHRVCMSRTVQPRRKYMLEYTNVRVCCGYAIRVGVWFACTLLGPVLCACGDDDAAVHRDQKKKKSVVSIGEL